MNTEKEIDDALHIITKVHENIAILHCVSQYPAQYENMNLLSIPYLKEKYPYEIGLSDHSIGIVMAPIAVALGAAIIEKHITLSRSMKGSDHHGSLEPDGLWRMVRDIRNVELSLGSKKKSVPEEVLSFKMKLERSIASARDIEKGEIIQEKDICLLSPGTGMRWTDKNKIVGKAANKNIPKHTILLMKDVQDD